MATIPHPVPPKSVTRFWGKVRKTESCWLWTRSCDADGYGWVTINYKSMKAHRVSWVMAHGPIPDGLFVLHDCDTPACVNPDHLFLGNDLDNHRDAVAKGRQAKGDRSGRRLHPERFPTGDSHPNRQRLGLTKDREAQMCALYATGDRSQADVAQCYGVSLSVLEKAWHRYRAAQDTPCPEQRARRAAAIRQRYRAGVPEKALRAEFGVSRQTVRRIVGGLVQEAPTSPERP